MIATIVNRFLEYWEWCAHRWEELAPDLRDATGYMVLNPGLYGAHWHEQRVRIYPPEPGGLLVVGLNPGPYGMAQTGVTFTDIKRIRERLPRLREALEQAGESVVVPGLAPKQLHPYLKLSHEASSMRIYHFMEKAFGDVEVGLTQLSFANSCPLLFIDEKLGKNRTPAHFRAHIRKRQGPWSAEEALQDLLERVRRLRLECSLAGARAIEARGAILLGKDVQRALGDDLQKSLGPERVVYSPHPARAVPETWSAGLVAELQTKQLL